VDAVKEVTVPPLTQLIARVNVLHWPNKKIKRIHLHLLRAQRNMELLLQKPSKKVFSPRAPPALAASEDDRQLALLKTQ
jgi:hypothetical protein